MKPLQRERERDEKRKKYGKRKNTQNLVNFHINMYQAT